MVWPTQEEGKKYGKKYDNVWTKEPHGGKYKLVGNKDGYDALECDSSGTLVVREPGTCAHLAFSRFLETFICKACMDVVACCDAGSRTNARGTVLRV
jgi:hypothetical protein